MPQVPVAAASQGAFEGLGSPHNVACSLLLGQAQQWLRELLPLLSKGKEPQAENKSRKTPAHVIGLSEALAKPLHFSVPQSPCRGRFLPHRAVVRFDKGTLGRASQPSVQGAVDLHSLCHFPVT